FRTILRIVVEARSRNGRDTDLLHQIFGECDIIGKSECSDIGHYVVRPTRAKAAESRFAQGWHETISSRPVSIRKILIIGVSQSQGGRNRILQRSRSADRQKIMYFANRIGDRWGADRPSHPPSRHAVTLR